MAYAAQETWVLNETIRDNILFGAVYDKERFDKVIYQTALTRDLTLFEAGEMTEVGEKGITLRSALPPPISSDSNADLMKCIKRRPKSPNNPRQSRILIRPNPIARRRPLRPRRAHRPMGSSKVPRRRLVERKDDGVGHT